MSDPDANDPYASGALGCYRHPDKPASVVCQRCSRPIGPECMVPAAVGFQCPECVRRGHKDTRTGVGPYGGQRSANPRVTSYVLVALNALVWMLIMATGRSASRLIEQLALIPLGYCSLTAAPGRYDPSVTASSACTARGDTWVAGVYSGAPWQVLTSAFTHVQPFHILMNMVVLAMMGPQIEGVLGRTRFLLVYGISAVAGSLAVCWMADPTSSTVGASGAVFGVLGALLVLGLKVGADMRGTLMWLGINVVYSLLMPGISWQGHLGGFLGGLAAAAILVYSPRENRSRWQWLGLGGLALVLAVLYAVRAASIS